MIDNNEQRIKIIQGNCVDKIKELEDNSIDCVVSSPPYFGLRDYGNDEQFGLEKTIKIIYLIQLKYLKLLNLN
jgi:DNA modification methylase